MTKSRSAKAGRDAGVAFKHVLDGIGSPVLTVVVGGLLVLLTLAFVVGCFVLGGLVTMLAWNLGVVAIVAACGGTVAKIGLLTGIFTNIALNIVSRLIRGKYHNPEITEAHS